MQFAGKDALSRVWKHRMPCLVASNYRRKTAPRSIFRGSTPNIVFTLEAIATQRLHRQGSCVRSKRSAACPLSPRERPRAGHGADVPQLFSCSSTREWFRVKHRAIPIDRDRLGTIPTHRIERLNTSDVPKSSAYLRNARSRKVRSSARIDKHS